MVEIEWFDQLKIKFHFEMLNLLHTNITIKGYTLLSKERSNSP